MRMRLKNKTALITGGNSGIGLATARLCVAEGARVAITGRNQTTLDAAAKALGPNVIAIKADTTDIEAKERAVATVVETFGNLDVVFANVGVGALTPLGKTTLATFIEYSLISRGIEAEILRDVAHAHALSGLNSGGSMND